MLKYGFPLALFIVIAVFLAMGLNLNPREIPSPLIGKPAPELALPVLQEPQQQLSRQDLLGKVWVLNVWASWCVSCRGEHPILNQLAARKRVFLVGLNYKDERDEALQWLAQLGNPYNISVSDLDGRVGIDYGVYGVPETFVMDKKGIIRHKFTGPVTADLVEQELLPLIAQLESES